MLCADWDLHNLSSIHATGFVEWEGYICGQNILLLCRAYGNQANIFLYVLLASYIWSLYTVLQYIERCWIRRGDGGGRKEEKGEELKGAEHNIEIPGDAEVSSGFYVNATEVVHLIQPTRMWICSFTLLPKSGSCIFVSESSSYIYVTFLLYLSTFNTDFKWEALYYVDVRGKGTVINCIGLTVWAYTSLLSLSDLFTQHWLDSCYIDLTKKIFSLLVLHLWSLIWMCCTVSRKMVHEILKY